MPLHFFSDYSVYIWDGKTIYTKMVKLSLIMAIHDNFPVGFSKAAWAVDNLFSLGIAL